MKLLLIIFSLLFLSNLSFAQSKLINQPSNYVKDEPKKISEKELDSLRAKALADRLISSPGCGSTNSNLLPIIPEEKKKKINPNSN